MRAHIASLVSSRGSGVGKGGRKLMTEKVGCTESDSDPSELMRPALVSLRTWHSCPLSNAVPSLLLALWPQPPLRSSYIFFVCLLVESCLEGT